MIYVKFEMSGKLDNGNLIKPRKVEKTYTGLTNDYSQDLPVPATVTTLLTKGAAVGGATLTAINNLFVKNDEPAESTKVLTVGLLSASDSVYFHLGQGEWLNVADGAIDSNVTGAVASTFVDITSVTGQSSSGTCQTQISAF